jgi:hypothetical protein
MKNKKIKQLPNYKNLQNLHNLLTTQDIDRPYREIGVIFVKGRHARYEKIVEKLRSEAKELEADAAIKIEFVYTKGSNLPLTH